MALLAGKNWRTYDQLWNSFLRFSSSPAVSSSQSLEESVKMAVANKSYEQIPDLLQSKEQSCKAKNPFSFLSAFTLSYRTQVVDEMLQSFIPLKPHSLRKVTYHYLLLYTLNSPEPFSLALATLQRTLRSGCTPVPQIHLLLSSAWIDRRYKSRSVPNILLDMKSIGYHPDCGTCNYIITSLCAVNQLEEAVDVLRGMVKAECIPDVESYSTVISAFSALRKTDKALTLIQEMVGKCNMSPRQGTLVKLAASFRANKEIWRAVEMIEFLEGKGLSVGFECYELVIEGCLEGKEYILAGKMAMLMTDNGYIPYIKVRQKVVEGLAEVGEWKLACAVRHKFAELNS